jgi:hypothetical protein
MRVSTLLDSNAAASLLRTVAELARHKQSAAILVNMPEFLPEKTTAKDLEIWSVLGKNKKQMGKYSNLSALLFSCSGPYFRLTSLPDEPRVSDRYFSNPIDLNNNQVKNPNRTTFLLFVNHSYIFSF